MLLPKENSMLLAYLLEFLYDVSLFEKENQMPASNLAIVFGPNLMRAATVNQTLLDQNKTTKFLTMLIQNYPYFQLDHHPITSILSSQNSEKKTNKLPRSSVPLLCVPKKSAMKSGESVNNSRSQELAENSNENQPRESTKKVNFGAVRHEATSIKETDNEKVQSLDTEDNAQTSMKGILNRFHVAI
jgi:hypothetical protein